MGKPGRSVLHLMAASVESNPYMSARLDEYVLKSPAMISRGKEVQVYLKKLEDLPFTAEGVGTLLKMAKCLPDLQQSLRSGSTQELIKAFRGALDITWDHCKALSPKTGSLLTELQALLVECGILFPLDTEINCRVTEVAAWRQQANEGLLLAQLQEACVALESVQDGDAEAHEVCIAELEKVLGNTGKGTAESMDEQTRRSLQMAGKCIMSFAKSVALQTEAAVKVALSSANVGQLVGEFLSDASMTAEFVEWKDLLGLALSHQKVAGAETAVNGESKAILKAAVDLQRKLHRVLEASQKRGSAGHPCQDVILKEVGVAKQTVDSLKLQVIDACKASVKDMTSILSDVAGGKEAGRSWLEGFEGSDFESLATHAGQHLLKINGKQLVDATTRVTEAI